MVSICIILALLKNLKLPLLLLDEVDGTLDLGKVSLVHSLLCNRMATS